MLMRGAGRVCCAMQLGNQSRTPQSDRQGRRRLAQRSHALASGRERCLHRHQSLSLSLAGIMSRLSTPISCVCWLAGARWDGIMDCGATWNGSCVSEIVEWWKASNCPLGCVMDRGWWRSPASLVNIWRATGAACFGARISYFGDQAVFVLDCRFDALCALDHRMTVEAAVWLVDSWPMARFLEDWPVPI